MKQTGKKTICCLLLIMIICGMFSAHAYAAVSGEKWVSKKGKYYLFLDGKKQTGLKQVGERTYYLDKKGVQRTGWRKIGKKYYFFQIKNGKDGYMRTSVKVNGVKLKKDGSAKLTSRSKRKLKVMVRCQKIMDSIVSPGTPKSNKLSKAFRYATNHFRARNIGRFSAGSDWDVRYAEYMLNTGSGDCYCYGAVFAYLANAAGYKNVCVCSSGGHGWCRISGRYYDPNWARVIGIGKCYGATRSQSGSGGRPAWAQNERYVRNISK